MNKILIFLLFFFTTTLVQAQLPCYDFSKRYDRFLKFGIGKSVIPTKDVNGRAGTLVFIEGEIEEFAMGLHANIRTGDTYLKSFGEDLPLSIDSRYVFLKNHKKNLQYGPYLQVNSTAMWMDGIVTGGMVRLRHEMTHVGFMAEASVPVFGYHQRVLNLNDTAISRSWFDTNIDPASRTRSSEYRFNLGIYFKINYY